MDMVVGSDIRNSIFTIYAIVKRRAREVKLKPDAGRSKLVGWHLLHQEVLFSARTDSSERVSNNSHRKASSIKRSTI